MSSIVLELQRDALDRSVPASDLLRKALVVARKLKLREFDEWISKELGGYDDEVPPYRVLSGQVQVQNPYHGWVSMTFQDPKHAEKCSNRACGQSVGELEALLQGQKESSMLMMPFPPAIEIMLMKAMRPYALQPMLHVSTASVAGILDTVRNTILNWALKLEEDGILGENLTFSQQERTQASATPYQVTNFYGPVSHSQVAPGARGPLQIAVSAEVDIEDIKALIAQVKAAAQSLDIAPDAKAELQSEIATVDSQVMSPKPKSGIIRESLASIRSILEGAGGESLGALIVEIAKRIMG